MLTLIDESTSKYAQEMFCGNLWIGMSIQKHSLNDFSFLFQRGDTQE